MIVDKNGRSTMEIKLKQEWNLLNDEADEANVKALYYIFNCVSLDEFYNITMCKYVKEA